jgi:hypothetical protein
MKITRRALALSALTGAAAAQTPAPLPAADEMEEAKKQVEATSQKLLHYEIPMSAEPAFQFKA